MELSALERTVLVSNPQGLHARPAEMLARLALTFDSEIVVIREGHSGDAKSIMHILTLGAAQGSELIIRARGADAAEALEAIVQLVQSDFATDDTMSQESAG